MDVYLGKKKWRAGYVYWTEDKSKIEFLEHLPDNAEDDWDDDEFWVVRAEYGAIFEKEEDVPYISIDELKKILENK